MKRSADRFEDAHKRVERELEQLLREVSDARAELARLQGERARAVGESDDRGAQLLEVNEQLVLSAVQAQADIDATAQALDEAARSAGLDPLTELPNRVLMLDRVRQGIATAKRHGARVALLFVDLDEFKRINDEQGHAIGDGVLRLTAQALVASVRAADTVSRHGGDEFLVLLSEITSPADAEAVAAKMIQAVSATHRTGSHIVHLTASVGISIYPDDGLDPEALIDHADSAMYHAKRQGAGRHALYSAVSSDDLAQAQRALTRPQLPVPRRDQASSVSAERHEQLREANERLVLAALAAQEKQAEAEEALKRHTNFLSRVAYELRSPLNPIRHATALLGLQPSDAKLLYRAMGIIDRQVTYINRLVSDLLDISRFSTGILGLELRDVDLCEILDDAEENWRPAMQARRQVLEVRRPAEQLMVRGDPVRLAQVLDNLLDNASRYTPEGGTIVLLVVVVEHRAIISLSDSGIGIPAESIRNVFDLFTQGGPSATSDDSGLGIGLTVVRDLIVAHHGTVRVTSAGRGHGTEVIMTLPLLREDSDAPDTPEMTDRLVAQDGGRRPTVAPPRITPPQPEA